MKVSIVTVCYNAAATIRDALTSVATQRLGVGDAVEHLVMDGGSTDGTVDVIREFADEVARAGERADYAFRWASERDDGMYDAMNKGINHCSGDVVGILNSDDFFTSDDIISKIAEAFTEDIDAVYGDIHFIRKENPHKCTRYYSSKIWRPGMLRFGFMPAHPTFYVRRSIYMAHGLYSLDYRIASDYDMMVRLFYANRIKAKYLPYDFVTMRQGGLSTQGAKSRLILNKEDIKACRRYGMKTNYAFISCKYFKKIFEFRF